MTIRKHAAVLAATGLTLLALCSSQALAGVRSDPARAAVLDPTFGGGGLVTLPGEARGSAAYGAATQDGDLIVSGGLALRLLSSSGDPAETFGRAGTLSPPPPEGGEFWLSDFTVDSEGRLLVLGTSRFPGEEVGAPPPTVPSAVLVLRFLPDGRPDPTFGQDGVVETDLGLPPPRDKHGQPIQPSASMEATGIAVDAQNRIVVTGGVDFRLGQSCLPDALRPVPVSAAFVARLTEDGALDLSFGGDGLVGGRTLGETPLHAESVGDPVVVPDGAITYRSTAIRSCGPDRGRWGVAQLTAGGRTRKQLGRKGAVGGYFTALTAEPDGSVVALARVGRYEGEIFRARLIRIAPDGEVDRSFGHHGRAIVKLGFPWGNETDSLAVDAQGRILLGGTLVTEKRKQAPDGKVAKRHRRSILLVRLSADGRQEMSFGPNGRVATPFPSLVPSGPSDLFLDSKGRVVAVHRYETREERSGLVLARYLLRN